MPSSIHPAVGGCGCEPECLRCFSAPFMSLRERFRLRHLAAMHVMAARSDAYHPAEMRCKMEDIRRSLNLQTGSPFAALTERSEAFVPRQRISIPMKMKSKSFDAGRSGDFNCEMCTVVRKALSNPQPRMGSLCLGGLRDLGGSIGSHSFSSWVRGDDRMSSMESVDDGERVESMLMAKLAKVRIKPMDEVVSSGIPTPKIAPPPDSEPSAPNAGKAMGWAEKWDECWDSRE